MNYLQKLWFRSNPRIENAAMLLLLCTLFFGVMHRGGISLQANIVLALGSGLIGVLLLFYHFKYRLADLFLLLFLVSFGLSFALSKTANYGLMELMQVLGGAIIYLAFSKDFFSGKKWPIFINTSLVFAILSTVIGFIAYLYLPYTRLAGSFQNFLENFSAFPNAYADFILMLIPFVFWQFVKSEKTLTSIGTFLLLVYFLSGFFLAQSQGALLVLLVLILIAFIYLIYIKHISKIVLFIFSILLAFSINIFLQASHEKIFPPQNIAHLSDQQVDDLEQKVSENTRIDFWKGSVILLQKGPLFGYGPDSFKFIYPSVQKELLANADHPHNLFLKYAVENGLPTMIIFILFLLAIFIPKILLIKRGKWEKLEGFQILAALSVLAFLVHQMIDYNLNFSSNIIVFWAFLGLLAREKDFHFLPYKSALNFRILIGLASLILITWSIHDAYYAWQFQQARAWQDQSQLEKAEILYEKAEPLWYKRDYYLSLMDLHLSKLDTENWQRFDKIYDLARKQNWYDARIYNLMGQAYLAGFYGQEEALVAKQYASDNFSIAIQQDPKNHLEYYYYDFITAPDFVLADERYFKSLNILLGEYLAKLRLNANYTILTDNPAYAVSLATELCVKKESFCSLKTDLEKAKNEEEKKLTIN